MKYFLGIIFLWSSLYAISQPGDESKPVKVRLFNGKGELISPKSTQKVMKCEVMDSWSRDKKTDISMDKLKFDNGWVVEIPFGDFLCLTVKDGNKLMSIETQGSLDSIQFTEGEFMFDLYQAYVFSIYPRGGSKISNLHLNNFSKGSPVKHSYFDVSESGNDYERETDECYRMAKEMELLHGGKGWARNTCNNIWEPPYLSDEEWVHEIMDSIDRTGHNDYRVAIHPLEKNRFILHEFFLDTSYDHRISITEDYGKTWKTLMVVKGEWYVNVVYFVNEKKIGIDISNSGVVLLSDFQLKDWTYYTYELKDGISTVPPADAKPQAGLVLTTNNWSDNYFGDFYFFEEK